jgi:hypothetical protein
VKHIAQPQLSGSGERGGRRKRYLRRRRYGSVGHNISDPHDAQDALHHSEAAEAAWDAGEYGTAASEAAQTASSMIEGVWDGLTGGSSEE